MTTRFFSIRSCLTIGIASLVILATGGPVLAQCGNVDGDPGGGIDISDYSAMVDYLFISGTLPANYADAELDGYTDVTISDLLYLRRVVFCSPFGQPLTGCTPPLAPPLSPPSRVGDYLTVSNSVYPSINPFGVSITLGYSSVDPFWGGLFAIQFLVGGVPAQIVPGTIVNHPTPGLAVGTLADSTHMAILPAHKSNCEPVPPGYRPLVTLTIDAGFSIEPRPIEILFTSYPILISPVTGLPVHRSIMIFSQFTGPSPARTPAAIYAATPTVRYGCCQGFTGNIDCDVNNAIDIADISALIDYAYISLNPLCCFAAANCDGSADGNVDIADLSALIDFLYITFTPTAPCP